MWEWHISTQQPARKQIQINDKRFPCLSPPSAPPSIGSLWSANVTGTSFSVCWSNHAETKQTYLVVLRKGSEVIQTQKISDTTIEVSGLKPGLLYNVTVTPRACGNQGAPLYISVKTCKYWDVVTLTFIFWYICSKYPRAANLCDSSSNFQYSFTFVYNCLLCSHIVVMADCDGAFKKVRKHLHVTLDLDVRNIQAELFILLRSNWCKKKRVENKSSTLWVLDSKWLKKSNCSSVPLFFIHLYLFIIFLQ